MSLNSDFNLPEHVNNRRGTVVSAENPRYSLLQTKTDEGRRKSEFINPKANLNELSSESSEKTTSSHQNEKVL